ncbi:MAG: integrase arm-type DNA-binding domain-containing protein, partial [Synergistaceae bacterium]|nr:integrase arm-type DNA-binding domain-containing protein [Synergistaceae bacterium]
MLTDSKVKTLKPADIRKRYADADGLYLEVFTNGTKIWEYRYTLNGKRKMMSIGEYPMVGIREARELRDQARRRLFDGEPAKESPAESAHVFQAVAEQWRENNNIRWTEKTRDITRRRLEMYILPFLGDRELAEIKPAEILSLARRLEAKDEPETAHRIVQLCGQIFQYAVACGYCEFDPTQSIRRALVPVKVKHFASLTAPP